MALSNNVSGRQFDSFTQVTDGTAMRVVTAPDDSSSGLAYTTTTGTGSHGGKANHIMVGFCFVFMQPTFLSCVLNKQ